MLQGESIVTKRPGMALPEGHPAVKIGKVGVLLVNLGTPEATDYFSMRRYLKEFLSDRRVIDVNRLLWWPLLNGIILTVRPFKSGHAYAQIWNKERNESPLKTITRGQAEGVAAILSKKYPNVTVDWAMRYGHPSIAERFQAMKDAGCDRILIAPLYPQYSATTTATVMDKLFEHMLKMRWQPAIRQLPAYHDHPAHIDALAKSLKAHLKSLDWEPDAILASFHGLPKRYLMEGDPYHCHCFKTARLLAEKTGLKKKIRVVFQSRFGNEEWLKPYAQDTIEALPGEGVKKVVMITPGFASDCVETLEEVAIGLKETFEEHGGEKFSVVPCLNDSAVSVKMLAALCEEELAGWI